MGSMTDERRKEMEEEMMRFEQEIFTFPGEKEGKLAPPKVVSNSKSESHIENSKKRKLSPPPGPPAIHDILPKVLAKPPPPPPSSEHQKLTPPPKPPHIQDAEDSSQLKFIPHQLQRLPRPPRPNFSMRGPPGMNQGPMPPPPFPQMQGPMPGPMSGPMQGPMSGQMQGPMRGPPMQGPMRGPMDGPMLGPMPGPMDGPMLGPMPGPMEGSMMGPMSGPMMGSMQGPMLDPMQAGPMPGPMSHMSLPPMPMPPMGMPMPMPPNFVPSMHNMQPQQFLPPQEVSVPFQESSRPLSPDNSEKEKKESSISSAPAIYAAAPVKSISDKITEYSIANNGLPITITTSVTVSTPKMDEVSSSKTVEESSSVPTSIAGPIVPEPLISRKKEKKKKLIRMAGGQAWEDNSLMEWDPDDFRIFCGDLGNDVTDEVLIRSFSKYPSFVKAKVIRDKRTNKTKGYGFVSFKDPQDFIKAMREMNGRYVGSRPIKLRKSTWKDRNIDIVRKKQREKEKLGLL